MITNNTRRAFLTTAGSASLILLAGCIGGDDDSDEPEPDSEGESVEIDPGTTIVLDGYPTHWEGIEPTEIGGVENPTLILSEGEDYAIEWINADSRVHNLEIRDDEGTLIDDLSTADIQREGERSDTLDFIASGEMAEYICAYHPPQSGELIVE